MNRSTNNCARNNNNNNNNNSIAAAHPACAACKHQRKKCGADCLLAPYFPAEKSREFQAVHKLFGVSNVSKIVRSLQKDQRKQAVDSLIWEAFCRQNDPVLGPLGEFKRIEEQLILFKAQSTQIFSQNMNSKQLVQLPVQAGMMQKVMPGMIVWNNGNNVSNDMNNKVVNVGANNNVVNYGIDEGIIDSIPYSYPLHYMHAALEKPKVKQEKSVHSLLVSQQQQQQLQQDDVVTDYDQDQFYLSGQYDSVNDKRMDSSPWKGPQ